jgi:hypothetical protein
MVNSAVGIPVLTVNGARGLMVSVAVTVFTNMLSIATGAAEALRLKKNIILAKAALILIVFISVPGACFIDVSLILQKHKTYHNKFKL